MPRTKQRWIYNGAIIRRTANKTYAVFKALGHCESIRRRFKTLEAATAFIDTGIPPAPFSHTDAGLAAALLPPGVSLLDCVRYYRAKTGARDAVSIARAIDDYLADVRHNLRARTLKSYRRSLSIFAGAAGPESLLDAVTADAVSDAIANESPHVFNMMLRDVSAFFSWCVRRGLCGVNPCANLSQRRIEAAVPGVLSVADGEALLRDCASRAPALVPYFALGMFAGLRPQETLLLRPEAIANGYILVDASIAKTVSTRTVPVRANLAAWLAAFPMRGRGANATAVKRFKASCAVEIPHDGLRHSFATYAYEQCKDAAAVAAEMGHQGTAVFFRHYRALCAPGDGAKWFSIMPP